MILIRIFAFALFMAVPAAAAAEAVTLDRIVAVVNDETILRSELEQARGDLDQENRLAGRDESLTDAELLQRLIDDKLAAQEAKRLNIEVSDKEIDSAVEDVLRQYQLDLPALKSRLAEQNIEYREYRRKISEQIRRLKLTNRTVRSRVVVDQSKMQAYYSEHREEFKDEPKVVLKHVVFQGPNAVSDANTVYAKKEIAPDLLDALVEELGGSIVDLGILRADMLNLELSRMVRELEPGQLSAPYETQVGVQILYLQDRHPERIKSFDEVKGEIEERLSRDETEKQFAKWLQELRDSSLVRVKL